MKKTLYATLMVLMISFTYCQDEDHQGFAKPENDSTFSIHKNNPNSWRLEGDGLLKILFGFGGVKLSIVQMDGRFVIPLRLDNGPRRPLFINSRFGYHQQLSQVIGFGGCIGKPNFWVTPQAMIALGGQDGLGLGLTAQAKTDFIKAVYETNFIVDFYKKNDTWFSLLEVSITPKIRNNRDLQIGIELEDNVTLEQRREQMTYERAENELKFSVFLRYWLHENFAFNLHYVMNTGEIVKDPLWASQIALGLAYRFEKN